MTISNNAGGSGQKTKLKSHIIRNTTTLSEKKLGDSSYHVVAWAEDVLALNTDRNLRTYTGTYNPKTRTRTHKAIADTIRNHPDRFGQRNGGLTVSCSAVQINQDRGSILFTDVSLINGAQSQGELKLFFDELEDAIEEQGFQQIEVKIEVLVIQDSEEETEVAISRNTTDPVKTISQAGARNQLNDLAQSMIDHNPNWKIETSESDKNIGSTTIDTIKLLQVTRLMTPDSILSPNKEITASEVLKSYKSAASCLANFCSWQENKDTDPEAKAKYECTISLAPKAWEEYEYWNSTLKWDRIQETYKSSKKRVCKKNSSGVVLQMSHGVLFPVLSAIKNFVVEESPGNWQIRKHSSFDASRMTKTAVRLLHNDYAYDPMIMGRAIGSYSALNEYPSAMVDILGLGSDE